MQTIPSQIGDEMIKELTTVAGSEVVRVIEDRGELLLVDVRYRWEIRTRLLPRTYINGYPEEPLEPLSATGD